MDAPLAIIFEMIKTVLTNIIGTTGSLLNLFGDLSLSLGAIAGMGTTGFLVAVLVLGIVLFFLGKFLLKSWKTIILLFIALAILMWFLF
jgi:hypothetical protein